MQPNNLDRAQEILSDKLARTTKEDRSLFVPPFKKFDVPDFNIEEMKAEAVKQKPDQFKTKFAPTFTQQFKSLVSMEAGSNVDNHVMTHSHFDGLSSIKPEAPGAFMDEQQQSQQSNHSELKQGQIPHLMSTNAHQQQAPSNGGQNLQAYLIKESQLKVLQLEHDLKLKEMKLQIQEMQSNTQLDDLKTLIM